MIDTDAKLQAALDEIRQAEWIALDTEADSLHAYPEKLCLIQLSIPEADLLVDPLSGMHLEPLHEALGHRELILHGADYDLRLLRKALGFVPKGIFDTMIASRLLGCREFGLTHLVSRYLNVQLEKGPQKANWARRPLTPRMEAYARNDTRYLRPLSDILRNQLKAAGRLEWHQETCAQLVEECSVARQSDPDKVWRIKGSQRLRPAALAVLRELWQWREREAIQANRPPYFILNPEVLVRLAAAAVDHQSFRDLLPAHLSKRRRDGIADAIAQGLRSQHPPEIIRVRTPRHNEAEKRRLQSIEQRRNRRASELGLDPTLIASRATLLLLAKDWEQHQHELMAWQRDLLAAD